MIVVLTLQQPNSERHCRCKWSHSFAAGSAVFDDEHLVATLLLDRDWLLIKTDFLLHAARNPAVADRLASHRQQLRTVIETRLDGARERLTLPDAIADIPNAARAVVAAYDAVTVQLLLDGDLQAARTWLTRLLTALLDS